jgi:hypothetical protein
VIALAATPFCPPGLPVVLAAAAALGAALLPAAAAPVPPGGAPLPPDRAAGPVEGPGEAPRGAAAADERPCR